MPSRIRLLVATLLLALLAMAEEHYINYTTVPGYFLQDESPTTAPTFDYVASNLGLIDRYYPGLPPWQQFEEHVYGLNSRGKHHVQHKVLYLGRHGEGYHNVAEAFYGTPAWDCYWSKQDGNGTVTWADARITEKGIQQAQIAHDFWAEKIANESIPVPETYYTSPLTRCLETAQITFSGLNLPEDKPFIPQVKEYLRETIGIHTCDRRGNKSAIQAAFPSYTFESSFAQRDLLWKADKRESDANQEARLKDLLDDIFTHDKSVFISFTSHSGSIAALLRAIKHRPFPLEPGGIIPVLVRAETIKGEAYTNLEPSTRAPACTVNPTPVPTPGAAK